MTGFYKIRAWSRGPWVPCEIHENFPLDPLTGEVLDRSPLWGNPALPVTEYIDGTRAYPWSVLEYGRPIDKEEFEWLKARFAILKTHPKLGQRWKKSPRNPASGQ